jgi:tetratricopeptide (TPR) repeat protein
MSKTLNNQLGPLAGALCLGLMLCSGCGERVSWLDRKEEAEPLMQRAALRANEGDVESAIRLYKKVLEENTAVGRAHLDIALLLHDHKKDFIAAIYHYNRYLELRPLAEKRDMIEGRMRLAEQLFAASIMVPGKQYDRISGLQEENMKLREEIVRLGRRLSDASLAKTAQVDSSAGRRPGLDRSSRGRLGRVSTYRVKRGDSLSSIATAVYGDVHRWKEIQIANTDVLGSSEVVKTGQLLIIP